MGLALGSATRDPRRVARGVLVAASLAADVGWCALTLAGVEGGRSMGDQSAHAPHLPWSHSALSTVALAGAFAAVGAAVGRPGGRGRLGGLAAVAVLLHAVAGDAPMGEGFPVAPWTPPVATLHLYAAPALAFAVETAVVLGAGAWVAGRPGWGAGRAARVTGLLLGLHGAAWAPTALGWPAVDLDADPLRILPYLVLLLAAGVVATAAGPSAPPP